MAKRKLEIIYEDEQLVAVNKQAGTLTIPDRFKKDISNLQSQLQERFGEIWTVHRLDKYTSGVVLFARTEQAHRHLSDQWMERTPEKHYVSIVDGVPKKEGRVEFSLTESMTRRGKMVANKRGKESLTAYKTEESFGKYSLVKLQIFTGRMHQIRVHMAEIGHPLIVDDLYGKRSEFFLSELKGRKFKLSKYEDERPLLSRQPLHAAKLVVIHPQTGESITFEAELPKDMRAVINQLRKNS